MPSWPSRLSTLKCKGWCEQKPIAILEFDIGSEADVQVVGQPTIGSWLKRGDVRVEVPMQPTVLAKFVQTAAQNWGMLGCFGLKDLKIHCAHVCNWNHTVVVYVSPLTFQT